MQKRSNGNVLPLLLILVAVVVVAGVGLWVVNVRRESKAPADESLPVMTMAELGKFDGKEGRLAYYAYEGKVYDVTASPLFKEGRHYGHLAGTDLTGKLEGAPHGVEVFVPFRIVARLSQ